MKAGRKLSYVSIRGQGCDLMAGIWSGDGAGWGHLTQPVGSDCGFLFLTFLLFRYRATYPNMSIKGREEKVRQ